jgi:toxin YoeB
MKLVFDEEFLRDLEYWARTNPEMIGRILQLVRESGASPMRGIGDPTLLPEWGNGVWARRIVGPHVFIYVFELGGITCLRCRNRGLD